MRACRSGGSLRFSPSACSCSPSPQRFFARRRLIARLVRTGRKPKLSAVMAALFVCLSIPILIFILAYNHYRNAEAILAILQEQVTKSRHASVESVDDFDAGRLAACWACLPRP